MSRFVDYLRRALRRFAAAERGNVAIIFAFVTIPMIGFVGAAVDYSRANSAKTAMQAAADSTALMLSREATGLTSSQLNAKANEYFKSLLHRTEVIGLSVVPIFTKDSTGAFKLALSVSGEVPTFFTKLIGKTALDISVASEVVWGMKKLELALALDNTGSMALSNKMAELKKAAKTLIDTLKKVAANDNDIRIAVIPFAQEVNVGTTNVNATWLGWDAWDNANGECQKKEHETKSDCEADKKTWKINARSSWDGCVMDRDQDYDVLDTSPTTAIKATLFPTVQAHSCPVSVLPLTSVKAHHGTLVSKVETMKPTGMTNVTIGLVWAWHALTPNLPLTEATPPNPETDRVIILLTDGDNTANRFSSNPTEIDARTKKVCDNVKSAGIKVYTIRVIDGNASLLQQCATRSDMYFNVQNASQLDDVFAQIAKNLANLRIAK